MLHLKETAVIDYGERNEKFQGSARAFKLLAKEVIEFKTIGMNPVSLIHEVVSRHGVSMVCSVSKEGADHNTIFHCRTTLADIDGMGIGRSIKAAKYDSAQSLIDKIILQQDRVSPHTAEATGNTKVVREDMKIKVDNPIGKLQEICEDCHWPHPYYNVLSMDGPLHNPIFTVECCFGTVVETGTGKTKKAAKSKSALKMLKHLKGKLDNNDESCFDKIREMLESLSF